jgi:general secretion pathway protein A
MYTSFYGLSEKPFCLTPDPGYLFLSASHREALAHVLYGIDQGEGFIAVTGEVGTGKTTLCRTLLQRLGPDTEVAFIFNPPSSGSELLKAVNNEFGLITDNRSGVELNEQLNEFLLEMKRAGRRVLLIVDEAQNLSRDTLEAVRLLSNLETSTSKLIQILLFGQPELDDTLNSRELRQLSQRISVRWGLGPMSTPETRDYVRHRLRIARGSDCDLFSGRALREVHRRTRGIPRLVNLLCDRSLLAGFAAGAQRIGPDMVSRAAREIVRAHHRSRSERMAVRWGITAGAFALAVLLIAWHQLAPGVPQTGASPPAAPAVGAAAAPVSAPLVSESAPPAPESLVAVGKDPG